jgi:hypothetical protein
MKQSQITPTQSIVFSIKLDLDDAASVHGHDTVLNDPCAYVSVSVLDGLLEEPEHIFLEVFSFLSVENELCQKFVVDFFETFCNNPNAEQQRQKALLELITSNGDLI